MPYEVVLPTGCAASEHAFLSEMSLQGNSTLSDVAGKGVARPVPGENRRADKECSQTRLLMSSILLCIPGLRVMRSACLVADHKTSPCGDIPPGPHEIRLLHLDEYLLIQLIVVVR